MDRTETRPARRSRIVGLFFALPIALLVAPPCQAQGPLLVPPVDHADRFVVPEVEPPPLLLPSDDATSPASDQMSWARLLRELSEEVIPPEYEVQQDWGDTAEVFAGFNVRTDGGRLRISKRTRRVNHGFWRRFRVQLIRPADRLRIELRNVALAEDGGLTAQVVVTARVRCTADAVTWSYGVPGPNTNVLTEATVRAVSDWRLSLVDNDPDAWIPEYDLAVEVQRVRLRILDFDVRRIGLIGGDIADELGDASRAVVEELLEQQESRVLRRLQRETGQLGDRTG